MDRVDKIDIKLLMCKKVESLFANNQLQGVNIGQFSRAYQIIVLPSFKGKRQPK